MRCSPATRQRGETVFSGADAFKLYDTFGFPVDLTIEMVEEEGMAVDEEGFQKLMTEQRERAREARKALGDLGWAGVEFGKEIPATEFVGYDRASEQGTVLAIVAEDELRESVVAGTEAIVVLDQTPFYAEMGGQVADHRRHHNRFRPLPRDERPEEQGRQVHALRHRGRRAS